MDSIAAASPHGADGNRNVRQPQLDQLGGVRIVVGVCAPQFFDTERSDARYFNFYAREVATPVGVEMTFKELLDQFAALYLPLFLSVSEKQGHAQSAGGVPPLRRVLKAHILRLARGASGDSPEPLSRWRLRAEPVMASEDMLLPLRPLRSPFLVRQESTGGARTSAETSDCSRPLVPVLGFVMIRSGLGGGVKDVTVTRDESLGPQWGDEALPPRRQSWDTQETSVAETIARSPQASSSSAYATTLDALATEARQRKESRRIYTDDDGDAQATWNVMRRRYNASQRNTHGPDVSSPAHELCRTDRPQQSCASQTATGVPEHNQLFQSRHVVDTVVMPVAAAVPSSPPSQRYGPLLADLEEQTEVSRSGTITTLDNMLRVLRAKKAMENHKQAMELLSVPKQVRARGHPGPVDFSKTLRPTLSSGSLLSSRASSARINKRHHSDVSHRLQSTPISPKSSFRGPNRTTPHKERTSHTPSGNGEYIPQGLMKTSKPLPGGVSPAQDTPLAGYQTVCDYFEPEPALPNFCFRCGTSLIKHRQKQRNNFAAL
jgi:hypothetical protein